MPEASAVSDEPAAPVPAVQTKAGKKLEKLSRAVNRRKAALQKLSTGSVSAVNERRLRKLVKQAQRRKARLEREQKRHAVKKPEAAAE